MRTITDHVVSGDAVNHQLTILVADEPGAGGANHRYEITGMERNNNPSKKNTVFISPVEIILFQNGPIKECGVNGVTDQALVALVMDRLRSFQNGPYACQDNDEALSHLEAYMECSHRRTLARIARGVEGTHQK